MAYTLRELVPTCFVTENRGLQDQMLDDYACIGLVDLRGRANYKCGLREDYTCEDGYASRCPLKGTVQCPSSAAEMRAAASNLVVTNYDKWMAARRFGLGLDHIQRVIFDEGDIAPAKLASAMQISINHKEAVDLTGLEFPNPNQCEEFVNWKPWIKLAKEHVIEELEGLRRGMTAATPPSVVKHYLRLKFMHKRLMVIHTANPANWVVEESQKGYVFDPVRAGSYTEGMLFL